MRIKGLELHRFRNYTDLTLYPEPGLNILSGLNAEGKTNVLESIFLCALGRSHRTPHDGELVMDGQPDGSVALLTETDAGMMLIWDRDGRTLCVACEEADAEEIAGNVKKVSAE